MRRSTILAATVSCAVGVAIGRGSHQPATTHTTTQTTPPTAQHPPEQTQKQTSYLHCDDPAAQQELEALRSLARLQEEQLAEMENQLYGQPTPWPDDVPEKFTPEVFEKNTREIFEACDVPIDIVDFMCEEAPCYVLIRRDELNYREDHPWVQALQRCAPWQERYGPRLSLATHTIPCEDGVQEGFGMLSPSPDWMFDWEAHPEKGAAQMKRFDVRVRQAKETWPCLLEDG